MNKFESKYFKTANLMVEALLLLLERKEFEYITIKELCEKAGVNRSTFYLHYDNMQDLLSDCINYLYQELENKYRDLINFDLEKETKLDNLLFFKPKFSKPYLEFIKTNKKAFSLAINYPNLFKVDDMYNKLYNEFYKPIQDKFKIPNKEQVYLLKYYISGIHAIIFEWLKNDFYDDIDFIAYMIEKCVKA